MLVARALGRREPTDWIHVEKYPLRGLSLVEQPKGVPLVWGVNWHSNFDNPVKFDGRWWIGRGPLGPVRGGHEICTPSQYQNDRLNWYQYYDQGQEGACVGFACSRMMSLLNRYIFDPKWLYHEAQATDEYDDTPPGEGTSGRAALDILRTRGHRRVVNGKTGPEKLEYGISAFRWATTVDEALTALNSPKYLAIGAIPILNSWGKGYPHVVWMAFEKWDTLLKEGGDCGVATDR